jgi:hypothetical protein
VNGAAQHRRAIVWLCLISTLLLGLAAQRHALGHAFAALHAPAHHDAWLGHAQACDQCLQFAAADAAAVASSTTMPPAREPALEATSWQPALRTQRFTAYVSRAPPGAG